MVRRVANEVASDTFRPSLLETDLMRMPPLLKRLVDTAIAIALTMGLVLVMVVISNLLIARSNSWSGFKLLYAFMSRPDILGTIILTALVSMAYVFWQQQGNKGPR